MATTSIWKNKRLRQILILVIGAIITLWMLIIVLFYKFTVSQHEQSTLMRLAGIANSLALQIDGDVHEFIFNQYPKLDDIKQSKQDSQYYSIHQILQSNFDANMLKSPVYTLSINDSNQHYEFGITSDSMPYYRHEYKSFHSTLDQKYHDGGMINATKTNLECGCQHLLR